MMKNYITLFLFLFQCSFLFSQISFPDLIIEDQTINTGSFVFAGPACIVSPSTPANAMVISGNADVEYKAAQCIRLAPGFSASDFTNGGKFRAHIVHPFDVVIMEPTITPGEVPKYEKLELGIKLPVDISNLVDDFFVNDQTGLNPFDPEKISIECLLTSPTKKHITAYGFYYREYHRDDPGDPTNYNWIEDTTSYHWRIRFAPDETGEWKGTIKVMVNGVQNPVDDYGIFFNCLPNTDYSHTTYKGILETGSDNRHLRFKETQESFFAIGENLCWANIPGGDYALDPQSYGVHKGYMDELSANGGNFIRLWEPAWGLGFEREKLGNYATDYDAPHFDGTFPTHSNRQMNAWELDRIFDYAKLSNIYIMLTLESDGYSLKIPWNESDWARNPYNSNSPRNGSAYSGVTQPINFFQSTDAKNYYKKKLRYFVARWGYSTNLAIIEFLNEMEGAFQYNDDPSAVNIWHDEMATYILNDLGCNRLMTSSYAGNYLPSPPQSPQTVFNLSSMDNTNRHIYHFNREVNLERRYDATQQYLTTYNKPFIFGEMGQDSPDLERCSDISFHNAIWSTAFMGGFGSGLNWWWDNAIHPEGYYTNFLPLSNLISSVDFENNTFQPQRYPVTSNDIFAGQGNAYPLEAFALVSSDKTKAIGWVHNRSYYWYNFTSNWQSCKAYYDTQPYALPETNNAYPFPPRTIPEDEDAYASPQPISSSFELQAMHFHPLYGYTYDVEFYNTHSGAMVTSFVIDNYDPTMVINAPYMDDNNSDYAFKIYTHGTNFKTTTGNNQNNYIAQNNHNTKTDIKGTENKVLKNQVLLYPNPTTGRFTISFNTIDESDMEGQKGDCKIIIYDVIGSIVYENNNIVLPFDININKYPVGVYAVRIQTKEDIYNTKITKL